MFINLFLYREEKLIRLSDDLKSYIPATFRPYLKMHKEGFSNENRKITTLVVNIELNLQNNSYHNYNFIQSTIEII
jgi:hypothetical protein